MDELDRPVRPIGEEWEAQMIAALRRRYPGARLTVIKALVGGDGGLEAFSHDGVGYQCYADRDSQTLRHRTDKQKDKINRDTLKLKRNKDVLVVRLGGMVLDRWVLLVPEFHAAELVDHGNERAHVIKSWNLPFIGSDFRIVVQDEQEYAGELRALMAEGLAKLSLSTAPPSEEEVSALSTERPRLVEVLDAKLSVLPPDQGIAPAEVRDRLLKAYLLKGKLMSELEDWPQTLEAIEAIRRAKEEAVAMESDFSPYTSERIPALMGEYAAELAQQVPSLTGAQAQHLSHGTVAEWLMRCPLRPRR
jgi:hypothetical protein